MNLLAGFEDRASDVLAGPGCLAERPEVDPGPSDGLVGLSQGGWVAPLAAPRSKRVDCVASGQWEAYAEMRRDGMASAWGEIGQGFPGPGHGILDMERHGLMAEFARTLRDWIQHMHHR